MRHPLQSLLQGNRAAVLQEQRLQRQEVLGRTRAHHERCRKQLVLALEVAEQRPLRHTRRTRDRLRGYPLEAALLEELCGAGEDTVGVNGLRSWQRYSTLVYK